MKNSQRTKPKKWKDLSLEEKASQGSLTFCIMNAALIGYISISFILAMLDIEIPTTSAISVMALVFAARAHIANHRVNYPSIASWLAYATEAIGWILVGIILNMENQQWELFFIGIILFAFRIAIFVVSLLEYLRIKRVLSTSSNEG